LKSKFEINWDAFREKFEDFLSHVEINSKDEGRIPFEAYDAQRYAMDEVFEGLKKDIHFFVIGKGRQLGISTLFELFDVFYCGAVPDMQGCMIFQDQDTRDDHRVKLVEMMDSLPPSHQLPLAKGGNNRGGFRFANGNRINYLIAGTKRGQGSLGVGRAYNYCHAMEVALYGDPDAFETFRQALSEIFPLRLTVLESTARGYNLFYDLFEEAVADDLVKRAIFVTWWRKRTYSYAKNTALFKRYGWPELSAEEKDAAAKVKELYDHTITLQQWAWYRHLADPRAQADADPEASERREVIQQEHPHYSEMMWRSTGSPFIPGQFLTVALARASKIAFKGYRYYLGDDVLATRIDQIGFANRTQLRVWQEPVSNGVYIVACDPAYGLSDDGDGFCIQVVRCYADKMVQVAEFNDRSIQAYQCAWVMLHLCAWYGNCRYIIELNGPGEAVWTELRNLKRQAEDGRLAPPRNDPRNPTQEELERESGIRNAYGLIRQYLYHRADSLGGGGYNYHMKTSEQVKFTFMTQFADRFMLDELEINSVPALKEIQSLKKDGRYIAADGRAKDDRPMALGLATRAYIDSERPALVSANRTFASEQAIAAQTGDSLVATYMSSIVAQHVRQRQQTRRRAQRSIGWKW